MILLKSYAVHGYTDKNHIATHWYDHTCGYCTVYAYNGVKANS